MEQTDGVERLRVILENRQTRPVSREEASEIAESLLIFFRVLGEGVSDGKQV